LPASVSRRVRESRRLAVIRLLVQSGRGWASLVAVYVVASAALPIVVLVAVGSVVGDVPAAARHGLASPAGHDLLFALGIAAVAYALGALLGPAQTMLRTVLKWRLTYAMQGRLMAAVSRPVGIEHLEAAEIQDQLSLAQGQLITYYPGEAPMILAAVISQRLAGLLACAVLSDYRWWLGLGMLAMWLVVRRPQRLILAEQARVFNANTEIMRRAFYLHGVAAGPVAAKETRIFGLGGWLVDRFRSQYILAMTESWRALRRMDGQVVRLSVIVLAGYVAATGYLGTQAEGHHITLASLAVLLPMVVATATVGDISWDDVALSWVLQALPEVESVESNLTTGGRAPQPAAPARTPEAAETPLVAAMPVENVSLEEVVFHYPHNDRPVLDGLDLTIPAGTSSAIVGVNGAGKTTLVKLLSGLYPPSAGRIVVDGTPLVDLDMRRWQRQVAVVFQDFVHYPLSARDNVGFGRVERLADADGLVAAARLAGASRLIESLPAGWETPLSSRYSGGVDLSGGQWQRVALSRALFAVANGARLLILDEPTAWLDARGEAEFFDRFLEITAGLTTVVISHRFSTVRRADRICVLDGGRLAEQGSHTELVAAGGRYAQMFAAQAARFGGAHLEESA
jgi:ATP-binding cassette subfamily B protein